MTDTPSLPCTREVTLGHEDIEYGSLRGDSHQSSQFCPNSDENRGGGDVGASAVAQTVSTGATKFWLLRADDSEGKPLASVKLSPHRQKTTEDDASSSASKPNEFEEDFWKFWSEWRLKEPTTIAGISLMSSEESPQSDSSTTEKASSLGSPTAAATTTTATLQYIINRSETEEIWTRTCLSVLSGRLEEKCLSLNATRGQQQQQQQQQLVASSHGSNNGNSNHNSAGVHHHHVTVTNTAAINNKKSTSRSQSPTGGGNVGSAALPEEVVRNALHEIAIDWKNVHQLQQQDNGSSIGGSSSSSHLFSNNSSLASPCGLTNVTSDGSGPYADQQQSTMDGKLLAKGNSRNSSGNFVNNNNSSDGVANGAAEVQRQFSSSTNVDEGRDCSAPSFGSPTVLMRVTIGVNASCCSDDSPRKNVPPSPAAEKSRADHQNSSSVPPGSSTDSDSTQQEQQHLALVVNTCRDIIKTALEGSVFKDKLSSIKFCPPFKPTTTTTAPIPTNISITSSHPLPTVEVEGGSEKPKAEQRPPEKVSGGGAGSRSGSPQPPSQLKKSLSNLTANDSGSLRALGRQGTGSTTISGIGRQRSLSGISTIGRQRSTSTAFSTIGPHGLPGGNASLTASNLGAGGALGARQGSNITWADTITDCTEFSLAHTARTENNTSRGDFGSKSPQAASGLLDGPHISISGSFQPPPGTTPSLSPGQSPRAVALSPRKEQSSLGGVFPLPPSAAANIPGGGGVNLASSLIPPPPSKPDDVLNSEGTDAQLLFKRMRGLRKKIRFAYIHLARPAAIRSQAEQSKIDKLPQFQKELEECEAEASRLGLQDPTAAAESGRGGDGDGELGGEGGKTVVGLEILEVNNNKSGTSLAINNGGIRDEIIIKIESTFPPPPTVSSINNNNSVAMTTLLDQQQNPTTSLSSFPNSLTQSPQLGSAGGVTTPPPLGSSLPGPGAGGTTNMDSGVFSSSPSPGELSKENSSGVFAPAATVQKVDMETEILKDKMRRSVHRHKERMMVIEGKGFSPEALTTNQAEDPGARRRHRELSQLKKYVDSAQAARGTGGSVGAGVGSRSNSPSISPFPSLVAGGGGVGLSSMPLSPSPSTRLSIRHADPATAVVSQNSLENQDSHF